MKTAIMTDTNSGITSDLARKLGVYVIHMPVIIDSEAFYEGENLTEKNFFDSLDLGKQVSTSQPSPGDVIAMWENIFNLGYEEIVYIPMSSGLSHSCEVASGLALDYKGKVQVADNHRISVTLKESVLHAKQLSDAGLSALEIKQALEKDAYNSSIYIAVNTLDYLKRGGRITPAAAMIGTMLSIKPILTIQGEKLDSFTKIRGTMQKCGIRMIEAVKADLENRFCNEDMTRLRIGLAGANLSEEEKINWLNIFNSTFPFANIYYDSLSASISCHTGPGALGIGISFR